MALLEIKNLSFKYNVNNKYALNNISLLVEEGEFICLSGESGCGKTTLLRLIKNVCSPKGVLEGEINFLDTDVRKLSVKDNSMIGFVYQNPENQIVTDTVWHELAFGLENLGYDNQTIRKRVAEVANFFGINNWIEKETFNLSGGEKQLLALASVLVMKPKILLLDEATSQLDPIATIDFMNHLKRINSELGITIILVSHSLDDSYEYINRLILLDNGSISFDKVKDDIKSIKDLSEKDKLNFPIFVRLFENSENVPKTMLEARNMLKGFKEVDINNKIVDNELIIKVKNAYFRYGKDLPDVLKDLNLEIKKGEILSILGGNGSGKTTLVKVITGIRRLYSGKVFINDVNINKMKDIDLYRNNISVISQNPYTLFVTETVLDELKESKKLVDTDITIEETIKLFELENIINRHPYDISGGEAQKVALAKMYLLNPKIIILDEATKGLDNFYKEKLKNILINLKKLGKTIVLVTHDMEFASSISDRCALIFNGEIVSINEVNKFFKDNSYFTTITNKLTKDNMNLVKFNDFLEAIK